jgi:hypothetical protein
VAYSNCLADVRVQVSQGLLLGAVLRAAALPSIALPLVRLSVVCSEVREPDGSSVVVNELRLSSLCQLRKKLPCYIRIDVLLETMAIGNVSANEQPGKPVVRCVQYDCDTRHSRVRLSSHCRCVVVDAVTVRCGGCGNSVLWWTR